MRAVITVKLAPETKGEAIDTFARQLDAFRRAFESGVREGHLSNIPGVNLIPDNISLRWLLDLPRFD